MSFQCSNFFIGYCSYIVNDIGFAKYFNRIVCKSKSYKVQDVPFRQYVSRPEQLRVQLHRDQDGQISRDRRKSQVKDSFLRLNLS